MFPLALLALAGFAGYQYAKQKNKDKQSVTTNVNTGVTDPIKSAAEKQNIYNYYTNDSTNGTTLFNEQQEKKRTLFGN